MGTFTKRLGQWAAKSLETESANIMKTCRANAIPGSLAKHLDTTLRKGHDMKVFGLGTAASMADIGRYTRFTSSMHAVYSAMEMELDKASPTASPLVHAVWHEHGGILRRAPSLALDLADVGGSSLTSNTPATELYVQAIRTAGADDRERGGARMLGHLYTRYFADLFGGSMLAMPYRCALGLPAGTPRHYTFELPSDEQGGRRAYIEALYRSLNLAGEGIKALQPEPEPEPGPEGSPATPQAEQLRHDRWADVIDETLLAFQHNIQLYSEEPMYLDGIKGCCRVAAGMIRSRERPFMPVSIKR